LESVRLRYRGDGPAIDVTTAEWAHGLQSGITRRCRAGPERGFVVFVFGQESRRDDGCFKRER
jgi:hypothetical protein